MQSTKALQMSPIHAREYDARPIGVGEWLGALSVGRLVEQNMLNLCSCNEVLSHGALAAVCALCAQGAVFCNASDR